MSWVRAVVFGVICLAVTACGFGSIADAKTGAELAPSLEPLRDLAPDHYRRLADGTFDALSFMEQRDFVDEVEELVWQRQEARRAESDALMRRSIIEFQDLIETLEPDVAEQQLFAWRKMFLVSLKGEDVSWSRSLQPGELARPLTRKDVPAIPPSPEAYLHASLAARSTRETAAEEE